MAKFQQKYERTEADSFRTPEQQLWISVLSKAAHDAIFSSDWREARMAITWFKDKKKDFQKVCELAGYNHEYVHESMQEPIKNRESHMEWVKSGNRYYVKNNIIAPKVYHSHYRTGMKRGPYKKKKHLTGNSYYAAKRKKDPYYVRIGKLGGRPRMYNNV